MKYTEQLKSSWGIFHKIWDMLTLGNWHWVVMGLFVASWMLREFRLLTLVLGIVAVGLLLVAYLREE